MKIAIVHEWLNTYGGSERVLAELLRLYPDAQVHALIHNQSNLRGTPLENMHVRNSFLQKIPRVEHLYRSLLPLMPLAISSMDLQSYDLVISISHAVAHGALASSPSRHLSYVCTPMRYAWHLEEDYLRMHKLTGVARGAAARSILSAMRRWDRAASARAAHLLTISQWIAARVHDAWGRESGVIYPPIDVQRFDPRREREQFYLCVSRLVPYKRIDEIVRAFNSLGLPLLVVGDGPQRAALEKLAGPNIRLLGYRSDTEVADLMSRARGFVYMAAEDFGLAMAEAQAAGCPVTAYARGGAAEIVVDGETGLLFSDQTAESMREAILKSRSMRFDSNAAAVNATRFSRPRFQEQFLQAVENALSSIPPREPSMVRPEE